MSARPWCLLLVLCGCAAAADPQDGSSEASDRPADVRVDRAGWVRGEIDRWNQDLPDDVRAAKLAEMRRSAFKFFRGTNHLSWVAQGRLARLRPFAVTAFLQGDLHPDNFGAYDVAGTIVYDVNDLDDADLGDVTYDLARLATGILLAGGDDAAVGAFVDAYVAAMAGYVGNDGERDRTFTADTAPPVVAAFLVDTEAKRSRARLLDAWTVVAGGERRFRADHADLASAEDVAGPLRSALPWERVKDVARRQHAGLASLGQPRYYVLVEGPTSSLDDDEILDIKRQPGPTSFRLTIREEQAAYLTRFRDHAARATWAGLGLRGPGDDHEGWLELADGSYTIRPLSPWKRSLDLGDVPPAQRSELTAAWGLILATGHARADDDLRPDWIGHSVEQAFTTRVAGHEAELRAAVLDVARQQAAQVRADHRAFAAGP
jgi:uncharacterized protein (DUF2252 family)